MFPLDVRSMDELSGASGKFSSALSTLLQGMTIIQTIKMRRLNVFRRFENKNFSHTENRISLMVANAVCVSQENCKRKFNGRYDLST